MLELDQVLRNLILPMVEDKDSLHVEMTSDDGKEITLHVLAASHDISHLIGRRGSMASSLRQVMSVASHTENKRVNIQFDETGEEDA